jgi:hypothetical protein
LIELANAIRRDHPRQRNVPKLLELLAVESVVDFETIRDKVHGAKVDDDAVEKTILRARRAIIEARLPIRITVSDRKVLRSEISD